jgi:hypothetical protein
MDRLAPHKVLDRSIEEANCLIEAAEQMFRRCQSVEEVASKTRCLENDTFLTSEERTSCEKALVESLFIQAQEEGIEITTRGDRLVVRGQRRQANSAKALVAHKADILRFISVYGNTIPKNAEKNGNSVDTAFDDDPAGGRWALFRCAATGTPVERDPRSWELEKLASRLRRKYAGRQRTTTFAFTKPKRRECRHAWETVRIDDTLTRVWCTKCRILKQYVRTSVPCDHHWSDCRGKYGIKVSCTRCGRFWGYRRAG